MSISIGRYQFDGPYSSTESLEDRSGVYAILDYKDGRNYLLDVGESGSVKTRVENHERKDCWRRNRKGSLHVAVFYTPHLQQTGRKEIEQDIRGQYPTSCGER